MIHAIVLGAGMSKRMGNKNKLMIKLKKDTILKKTIKNILSSNINGCTVVLGYEYKLALNDLRELNIDTVINKYYKEGLSSSIKAGIRRIKANRRAVMICLGDMPFIKTATYNQLIENFIKGKTKKKIVIPYYKNLKGNPIIFSHHFFCSLKSLKGDYGAKQLVADNKNFSLNITVEDRGVVSDIDTKVDLKLFLK